MIAMSDLHMVCAPMHCGVRRHRSLRPVSHRSDPRLVLRRLRRLLVGTRVHGVANIPASTPKAAAFEQSLALALLAFGLKAETLRRRGFAKSWKSFALR